MLNLRYNEQIIVDNTGRRIIYLKSLSYQIIAIRESWPKYLTKILSENKQNCIASRHIYKNDKFKI